MLARILHALTIVLALMAAPNAFADASGPALASYYDRHMALVDGVAYGWTGRGEAPATLMRGLREFAAGQSGWLGIDAAGVLWQGSGTAAPQRIADNVVAASVGDGADYYVTRDGALWVKGLAHRGQYGDGKLSA